MPTVYLSPSLQEYNPYVIGGSEEYYMNLVADAMEPYLVSSGLIFIRNAPEQTLAQVIAQSDESSVDFHLAIHSNASPPVTAGKAQGSEIYFDPASSAARKAAEKMAARCKQMYPHPHKVKIVPTQTLAEPRRPKAVTVLVELAYHDQEEDAIWIRDNIHDIARHLVMGILDYFDLPFAEAMPVREETVRGTLGGLNFWTRPDRRSAIAGRIPSGARVVVLGHPEGWYVVRYQQRTGYLAERYIDE